MTQKELLHFLSTKKTFLHKRFGVKKLALFGSYAKNRQTPTSDIDILVELENEHIFRNFFALKEYLEKELGSKVDLGTFRALKPSIKQEVLKEAIYV